MSQQVNITAGLLTGNDLTFNVGLTYQGATPPVPASGVPVTNTTGYTASVAITGGLVTSVSVNGSTAGSGPGTYALPNGQTIAVTYSAAPSWTWTTPLNLATVTSVTAYLKQDATEADATGKTYTTSNGLTITNSSQGLITWLVPRADVGLNRWYRFDVLDVANHISTAVYGRLIIQDV